MFTAPLLWSPIGRLKIGSGGCGSLQTVHGGGGSRGGASPRDWGRARKKLRLVVRESPWTQWQPVNGRSVKARWCSSWESATATRYDALEPQGTMPGPLFPPDEFVPHEMTH